MTREEFTVFINILEKKYPVNQWRIDGVHVWPLIKIKLSFVFQTTPNPEQTRSNPGNTIEKTKKAFKGLLEFLKILSKRKTKTPTTLFCLAPHFRYYDGIQFNNRYFNQLIDQTKEKDSDFLIAEYGNTTKYYREKLDFQGNTIFLENLKFLALFLRELTWKRYSKRIDWPEYDFFLEEVQKNLNGKRLTKEAVLKQFVYIKILKGLYGRILKKNSINEVYLLCYYVSEMYAMNLATSELGINSWDVQHGGQGSLHVAYANFNVIPKTGYKLLPRKFWTWDTASASEIAKWTANSQYHEVKEKGNPWIDYCVQRYTAEIDTSKKIILYTMQPVGDILLDTYIIECIKKTPPDYIWWLRLHPRQLKEKSKLEKLLKEYDLLGQVNFEDATTLPLPGILSNTYVHLSKFSGSILEAYIMKVKSIVLSEIGVESFPKVINTPYGIIHLEGNSDILIDQITTLQ